MRQLKALAIAAVMTWSGPTLAAAPEAVEIAREPVALKGFLYRPEGKGPFPAIVALHSCEGLTGQAPISERYRDWGERLMAAGFVVLFPDSFGARGMGPQCSTGQRSQRSGRDRVGDVEAARHWLQQQDYVAPDRVSLLGWANGAVAALWSVRPRTAHKDGKPDFRSAVALHPGCRLLSETAWSARAPTLILIGAKDDWTPAAPCEQMVAGARGRSARTSIIVYPGAYHDFDYPNLPLQVRTNVASRSGTAGRTVHVGTDPAARADAMKRAAEWIMR